MMQKLFKLIVSISVLSLMFITVSCKHSDSKDPATPVTKQQNQSENQNKTESKETTTFAQQYVSSLGKVVHFGGTYYGSNSNAEFQWIFSKDSKAQVTTITQQGSTKETVVTKLEATAIETMEMLPSDYIGYLVTFKILEQTTNGKKDTGIGSEETMSIQIQTESAEHNPAYSKNQQEIKISYTGSNDDPIVLKYQNK